MVTPWLRGVTTFLTHALKGQRGFFSRTVLTDKILALWRSVFVTRWNGFWWRWAVEAVSIYFSASFDGPKSCFILPFIRFFATLKVFVLSDNVVFMVLSFVLVHHRSFFLSGCSDREWHVWADVVVRGCWWRRWRRRGSVTGYGECNVIKCELILSTWVKGFLLKLSSSFKQKILIHVNEDYWRHM